MTYEQWMAAVNVVVESRCGLSMCFLPDWLSRDAYDDGLSPEDGAEICLERADYYSYS